MNPFRLHTQYLKERYGPIHLEIVRQENGLRMVHLRDTTGVSRTLGVVKFYGTPHESIAQVHRKILDGSPLGATLLEAGIDFEKRIGSRFLLALPGWLSQVFLSGEKHASGVLSDIYVRSTDNGQQWPYARVLEVIPLEVYTGMTPGDLPTQGSGPEVAELLNYANLKPSYTN